MALMVSPREPMTQRVSACGAAGGIEEQAETTGGSLGRANVSRETMSRSYLTGTTFRILSHAHAFSKELSPFKGSRVLAGRTTESPAGCWG